MKIYFPILLLSLAVGTASSQVFPCKKESVKLYNVKIEAVEVTGQKCFNSNGQFYRTSILNPMIGGKVSDIMGSLGSYRTNYLLPEAIDLFNLSLQKGSFPLLDSIDFDYYENVGFDKIPDEIKDSNLYQQLKKELDEKKRVVDKKKILFDDRFKKIRLEVLKTRYKIRADTFKIDQHKVNKTTASLKAKLDSIIITSGVTADAAISGYLSKLADETVVMKGVYYEFVFTESYMAKIEFYISQMKAGEKGSDQFIRSWTKYNALEKSAVNTGIAAIGITGGLDKKRIEATSLATELRTKLNIPQNTAAQIAVSMNVSFRKDLDKTVNSSFDNVFVIRYFTSLIIDALNTMESKEIKTVFVNDK